MTACTANNTANVCPQRHTCALHQAYLEVGRGPAALVSMPVSAGDGCYRLKPIEIKTV